MTREEAIRIIEYTFQDAYVNKYYDSVTHQALNMAIEALSKPINCVKCKHYYETEDDTDVHGQCRMDTAHTDLISRADAEPKWNCTANFVAEQLERLRNMTDEERWNFFIKFFSLQADAVQRWIPFKKRPLTDEEKEEYPDWAYIFDCPLPEDEEEILLTNGVHVWTDTFINDGECYLDGGDDIDDDMAWMPLPTPYKGGDTE